MTLSARPPAPALEYLTKISLRFLMAVGLLAGWVGEVFAGPSDPPQVWLSGPLVKVLQDAPAGTTQSLQMSAARNEFESFQVHLRAGANPVQMNLTVSDFVNTQNDNITIPSAGKVFIHREAYLNITTLSDQNGRLGITPDPLIPTTDPYFGEQRNAFPFTVPPDTVQSAWIDVLVPADALAGTYAATVTVTDGSTVLGTMPVLLKVWSFALPSTASLKSYFGMSWNGLCFQAYAYAFGLSGTGYDQCASYPGSGGSSDTALHLDHVSQAKFFLDHRITTDAVYIMTDTGTFDGYYAPLLNGTAATLLGGAKLTSLRYAPPGYRVDDGEIQGWVAHFSANGWLASLFDYTFDEPHTVSDYQAAYDRAAGVHTASQSMQTLVTTTIANASQYPDPSDNLLAKLNILAPTVNDVDPQGGTNQRSTYQPWLIGGAGRHLWWYQACSTHGRCTNDPPVPSATWPSYMVDATPVRNRVFQWLAFVNGIEGELYYQSDYCWFNHPECQSLDPWSDVFAFGGNGDGTLIYPGRPSTINGTTAIGGTTPIPIASIRLKHIRDGMEDYEYLVALSRAGDDAFAQSIAASFITNAYTFDDDPQALASAREALGDRLHQLTSNRAPTTVTGGASPNPSAFGQQVMLTATVTAAVGTPTGTVTFLDGATPLGTVPLSGSTASLSVSSLAIGSHTIRAVYDGDANFAASMSGPVTQSVGTGTTTTDVSATPNPSNYGQSVTFSTTVTGAGAAPTGSVSFLEGSTLLGTASLTAGSAAVNTSALSVGSHTVAAVYAGDANYEGSTSSSLTQIVNPATTTTSLASSPNPSVVGQSVTLTATVASSAGTPTGTISFMDGSTTLGTGTLSGGTATFPTTSLTVGNHTITAVYGGDGNFSGSTSPAVTQTVNNGDTTTALAAAPNPSAPGQSVTFTATVAPSAPAAGVPTGTVTFKDGSTTLGSGTLSGGTASLATSTLTSGSHLITALYGGDATFNASTSTGLTQLVRPSCLDQFIDAFALSDMNGTIAGNNALATGEAGEPDHAGASLPLNSVWCKWAAPANGPVLFDTTGSDFDTTLAVYTGTAVSALTPVAANNDFVANTLQSRVIFNAIQGVTYYVAVDGAAAATGNYVLNWTQAAAGASTSATVLPYARSVTTGTLAVASAALVNMGSSTAFGCSLAKPPGFPAEFTYQTTNSANQLTGTPDTPVDIGPGLAQGFVFGITPSQDLNGAEVAVVFGCTNTPVTPSVPGLNTLLLSASSMPPPDIVALTATQSNAGIVNIPGNTGTGSFARTFVNAGTTATITVSADDGGRGLPITLSICQTLNGVDANASNCLAVPASTVTTTFNANATLTYLVIAQGSGNIPLDVANNRLFLRLKDLGGVTRGAASVAVRTFTQPPPGIVTPP